MKKTESAKEVIKSFLEMVPGIQCAFIHSFLSKETEEPEGGQSGCYGRRGTRFG